MRKTHSLNYPLLLYAGHKFVPQEVPWKEVNEGHRTLGVCLDPSISFKDEVAFVKKISNQIAGRICCRQLKKLEVQAAYKTMYLPKLCYEASVTSLTKEQA